MDKKVFLINVFVAIFASIVSFVYNLTNQSPTTNENMQSVIDESEKIKNIESQKTTSEANLQQEIIINESQERTTQMRDEPQNLSEALQDINKKSVDYEEKFGKRIYLATKDEFVNMRNAPSGEIIAQIYKKDFESIMIYSFDANSNGKWLKVMYFPPNVKDEQNAISGYIHISQIDKNKLN